MNEISLPDIGDKPYQPLLSIPRCEFGSKKVVRCSFRAVWFRK